MNEDTLDYLLDLLWKTPLERNKQWDDAYMTFRQCKDQLSKNLNVELAVIPRIRIQGNL